jgi:hypothetical protein
LTSSIIQYSKILENTTFQKQDLFPSSGERGDTSMLGPLKTANLDPCQFPQRNEHNKTSITGSYRKVILFNFTVVSPVLFSPS